MERFIPSFTQIFLWLPVSLVYAILSAWIAGYLRVNRHWHYAYTRKVFHFLIFTVAGILHLIAGLPVVMVFGAGVALVVVMALYRDQSAFFKAIARESDRPHIKIFILIPLATTALGGLLSNYFFAEWALIGYWVTGWGDAVGEPAGRYFGKHFYSVPTLAGGAVVRSLEGSAAVFCMSVIVAWPGMGLLTGDWYSVWFPALACALGGTVIEAVSHHGLDNLTIQVGVSGLAWWLML